MTTGARQPNGRWSKADYLFWLKVRAPDAGNWNREDCEKADALIRSEAIEAFHQWSQKNIPDMEARAFMRCMVRVHFGSTNVDHLLTKLHCYPDWLGE